MRTVLIAALALVPAACQLPSGNRPDEEQMLESSPLDVPGQQVVWVWVEQELGRAEFRLDTLRSNQARGEFETQWDTIPSPQRYSGIRRKVVGRIVESDRKPGAWVVRLAVWRQRNADIENPMETAGADWQNEEPDGGLAELLLYRIEQRARE